jgi:ATP-dependent RNA helicase DHX37/DHR1
MEGPNKRPRRHIDFTVHEHEDSESDAMDGLEEADQMSVQYEHADSVTSEVAADPPTESTALHTASLSTFAVGGALKRNPDGSVVATLVVNNKSEKRRKVC